MRKVFSIFAVALCTSGWLTLSSCAEAPQPATEAAENEVSAGKVTRKPEVLLRQMADYLGNLPAYSCRADMKIHIQAQGIDNTSETKMIVRVQRPNRLALIVDSGPAAMTIVSDGKQLAQHVSSLNRYVVFEAPEDLSKVRDIEGLELGMIGAILPISGEELYESLTSGVTGSAYLGTEQINDVQCHRLKFLQEDFNWEIWIEASDRPLPHKVVPDMSHRFAGQEGMAKLEYVVMFSDWNVAPKFTDADFEFEPPADAEQVDSLFEGLAEAEEGPHPMLGQPAPPFETVDLDGQPIDLSADLGKNVIMLDFWATWCGPCIEAMPEVDAVAKKFADRGVVFYAVNVAEDVETVKEFLKTGELEVPVAMDPDGRISSELYRAEGIPQTVLIGKDGKVQVVHVGFSEKLGKLLTAEIEDLLAGKDLAGAALADADEPHSTRDESDSAQLEPVDDAKDGDGEALESDEQPADDAAAVSE